MPDEHAEVDDVATGQHDRLAAHIAVELEERDHRTGEGYRTDRDAQAHLDPALGEDHAAFSNAERAGVEERRARYQHRRHADQRMKRRNQLRHGGHRDPPRGDDADRCAKQDGSGDFRYRQPIGLPARIICAIAIISRRSRHMREQRRHHRDRHADHAEAVAALARGRARQPAQREDEAHPRDQIGQRRPGFGEAPPCQRPSPRPPLPS